jgi:hypothetical protein
LQPEPWFHHPRSGEQLYFEAPLPEEWRC